MIRFVRRLIESFMLLYERHHFPSKGDIFDVSCCTADDNRRRVDGRFICLSCFEQTEYGRVIRAYSSSNDIIMLSADGLRNAKIIVSVRKEK